MELLQYLGILNRRKWVIFVTLIVTIAIVFLGSYWMTPIYSTSAVVRIAQIQDGSVSYNDLNYLERLINTYVELLDSRPFLEQVIQRLNISTTPVNLAKSITVEALPNTELIMISAESTNPKLAMEIANALGALLVEQRDVLYSGGGKSALEILQDQLSSGEETLAEDRALLQSLIDQGIDVEQDSAAQNLMSRIQAQEQTYMTLLTEYERTRLAEAARANSISIVEPAIVPDSPAKPRMMLNISLGALVGLVGGFGLSFLFEYLDSGIYDLERLREVTQLPVLGTIPRLKFPKKNNHRAVLVIDDEHTLAREAYRVLRTNVDALATVEAAKILLVASAERGAGKSTVVANLAVAISLTGRNVIIVDSDLRNPCLHETFDRINETGLSTMVQYPDQAAAVLQNLKTKVHHVNLLTSGPIPSNPTELIGSMQMRRMIEKFRSTGNVALFDSPAILTAADAAALASMVDGVILVGTCGKVTERSLQISIQQLNSVGAKIVGVVFNKANVGNGSC